MENINMQRYPALSTLLKIAPPQLCSECYFGKPEFNHEERARMQIWDESELNYSCSLLNLTEVWGESPQCKLSDWQERGSKELEGIMKKTREYQQGE